MAQKELTKQQKEKIIKRVQREFPGCKSLQEIHFYRYSREIEWETLTAKEIVDTIKEGAGRVRKEMGRLAPRS
jgi:hypothetical protein